LNELSKLEAAFVDDESMLVIPVFTFVMVVDNPSSVALNLTFTLLID